MGIHTLPQSTVRTLGASQVLNDPASVVKELLENALDAHATSVSIEISANTLDTIQVRDNGHGIPAPDRHLIARPHCTSKITGEEDLLSIGGTSLGFRGEALASVADMSGALAISTRVEGEQVATVLKIDQHGEVEGTERASLPVGTTVKITDFLKSHPVRRQIVLKDTEKCFKKIKRMLQAYIFTRPNVRLSLRVLKAKNDKANWTYAPKAGGSVEDAALKVVGSACATQCEWSVMERHGFTVQGLLPRLNADPHKVSNIGLFLSIDRRPVSTARGTPRQIIKVFREALKSADAAWDGVKEPFIYLDISCPQRSYDANVEPGKDDVLFESPDQIIDVVRELMVMMYPVQEATKQPKIAIERSPTDHAPGEPLPDDDDDFFTSLEDPSSGHSRLSKKTPAALRLVPNELMAQSAGFSEPIDDDPQSFEPKPRFRANMYGCDDGDVDHFTAPPSTAPTEAEIEELERGRNDVHLSNPWVMAKMHAVRRQGLHELENGFRPTPGSTMQDDQDISLPSNDLFMANGLATYGLPTPRPSSPLLSPQKHLPANVPQSPFAVSGPRYSSSLIEPPIRLPASGGDATTPSQLANFQSDTPLDAIPNLTVKPRCGPKRQQQTKLNRPFVSPLRTQEPREKVWFDHLEAETRRPARARKKRPYHGGGLVTQGELGDLNDDPRPPTPPRRNRDMRDFVMRRSDSTEENAVATTKSMSDETRQKPISQERVNGEQLYDEENRVMNTIDESTFRFDFAAIEARFREELENEPRPTKRRRSNNARVLREVSENLDPISIDDKEPQPLPRKRTISRRRRTTDKFSPPRIKSSQLPLERTPAEQGTHNLALALSTSGRSIIRLVDTAEAEAPLSSSREDIENVGKAFSQTLLAGGIADLAERLKILLNKGAPAGEEVIDGLAAILGNALNASITCFEHDHGV